MGNKLGMHIHGLKPGVMQAVELLQPRTITIMDPTPRELRDIYSVASPVTVVRKYEHGASFRDISPRWWAGEYYRMVGDAVSDKLVALGMNEPFGQDAQTLCAPFDEWNRAFIERCRELGPMDGGALAMATGNWTGANDRYRITDDFPDTCEIARWFLLHEYCWPTLQVGVPWHVLRYRAWIEDLEATGKEDFFFIISEAGLTQAVIAGRPDHGFRSGGPEGVTEDSYISTVDWYNARLCEDWRVLGCCLYDWAGGHYGWETFEQLGLELRIFRIQAPEIPEPEPEPPGGEPMDVRVFNVAGDELFGADAEDMVAYHGLSFEMPPGLVQGARYFKLIELREKASNALITRVLDLYGEPVVNPDEWMDRTLAHRSFWWPAIDADADDIVTRFATDYHEKGDLGGLNINGEGGSGMGRGAYHDPYESGPHECWVRHPFVWSMLVGGQGMQGGTDHLHLDMVFQETVYVGDGPGPEPDGDLLEEVEKVNEKLDVVIEKLGKILELLGESPTPEPGPEVFHGEYFDNKNLSGLPTFAREDGKIDFYWADDGPGGGIDANEFSVRWIGDFAFEDGSYTFLALVDDGLRLWVDGILYIDAWHDQPPTPHQATVTLSAGKHVVMVEYYENAGDATCTVAWEKS